MQIPLKNQYQYYRIYYILFAFITLGLVIFFQLKMYSPLLFIPTPLTNTIGYAISITGLVIMFICIKKYFISLSGLKSLFTEEPSTTLMINGIHKYVRHPLYSGTFIFIWGLLVLLPHWSLLLSDIIITAYTLYAIRLEEEKLIGEFGEDYKLYRQQVPKLIPYFKKHTA